MTTLADASRASFSRHETFAPRYGWLEKAYAQVVNDDEVFLKEEAPVILGVGKNMVNAIRYWSAAFKLTIEHPQGGSSRKFTASPTWEARWLLDVANGADPALEDPGSLWLLHWWLLAPTCLAPTWWVAFNALPTARFSEKELTELVLRQIRLTTWEPPAENSVGKDADCLTKMYAPRKGSANSPGSAEDLLWGPFRGLGLIEAVPGEKHLWRFTSTTRTDLAPEVLAYACLDYAARAGRNRGSISTARLANEPGAPGRAFCMREPELFHSLEKVCDLLPDLHISETVGNRTLVFDRDPFELAWDVLDSYYGNVRQSEGMPTREQWLADHPDQAAELKRRQATAPASAPILEPVA